MKKYLLLLALVCLLGNSALAQNSYVTEEMDFSLWNSQNDGRPYANVNWSSNGINSISSTDNINVSRDNYSRLTLNNRQNWQLWKSGEYGCTYLQMHQYYDNFTINNLKTGDLVTFNLQGNYSFETNNHQVKSTNSRTVNNVQLTELQIEITSDGYVKIGLNSQYAGIKSITIKVKQQQQEDPIGQNFFNYDPGYEVYDFFEVRDVILERDNDGNITKGPTDNTQHTNYSVKDADFNLNGNSAQYFTFNDNSLTLNNRIAISQNDNNNDGNVDRWNFQRGLKAPTEGDGYFSITNLKKGDRVQIFYLGEAPVFASQADGTYNGCSAFYDRWNDGNFDSEDGDHFITPGTSPSDKLEYIATREEGTIRRDEQISQSAATLYSSATYVITEDGHMDFRLNNNPTYTRIVKVYIWSDHQATMIDDTSERLYQYTSHFDITGELQAKEHIVPGGLEVRIGNEDKSQHAIVVASKEGPVSYVNAVDGFKLPGVTGSVQNGIQINFDLGKNNNANSIPTTGTFYKFIPEVDGTMKVKFTPYSMYYYRYDIKGNAIYFDEGGYAGGRNHTPWKEEYGRGNEQTANTKCPYYVKVSSDNGQTFSNATGITWTGGSSELMNGGVGEFVLEVEAGKTYYLFGGWTNGANGNNTNLNNFDFMFIRNINNGTIPHACGVAELFDVAFTPAKQIYPLAKWVPSGTKEDPNLATIVGYHEAELTVKKMSGNITQCDPYIYQSGTDENNKPIYKLGIRNIEFKSGENPGGVVLIKLGTVAGGSINYYKVDPVYVFTVAYDADYKSTSTVDSERGHTWDFSSSSLNGLEWNTTEQPVPSRNSSHIYVNSSDQNFAQPHVFGTYFKNYFGNKEESGINTGSFLYNEMHYVDNGVNRSDWMFNYRQQKNGVNYDPRFLNKYDMEGDNADMIWDTEGIIIEASSNFSCMFNEFGDGNIHSSEKDPDRYVGILSGGSFLIPHLNKDDRVIIYMGSGVNTDEMVPEDMRFHITNARDAEYKLIDPEDVYLAGGSLWKGKEGDNNYRGCYHFFAQADGDMKFTLEGSNSICKLYKIQIYRGDRIDTNEIMGATENDKFLLWSRDNDPNDNTGKDIGPTYNWTLKYFGKDQKLANGSNGVNNGIPVYDARPIKTGVGINLNGFTTSTETDPTKPTYNTFKYTHDYGQIGTFRMRGKDMEKNMKYVADYAEHNVTVAYQETMKYPYTWDFKDMIGFGSSNFLYEDQFSVTKPEWYESEPLWNTSYEKSSTDLSLWGKAAGNAQDYALRLSTQEHPENYPQDNIFESAQDIDGNQLWANGAVVPETQGLWFHTPDQITLNSSMRVYSDGMSVGGNPIWQYNMVVPNVPAGAAVYMRIKKAQDYRVQKYKFAGSEASELTLIPVDKKNTNDPDEWIAAIKNSGETKKSLTLSFVGYTLEKLAVSTDPKAIGQTGYATESRARDIDHELTSYLTGKNIKAYTAAVSNDYSKVVLSQFGAAEESAKILPAAQDGDMAGCILYHDGGTKNADGTTNRTVSILDGGFHVFVPDMHDKENADRMVDIEDNQLKAFEPTKDSYTLNALISENRLAQIANTTTTNLILSAKKMYDGSSTDLGNGYDVFFIRPTSSTGAAIKKCSSYIQVPTSKMVPLSGGGGGNAKLSIVFFDELFGEINNGIATGISEVNEQNASDGKAEWYSLDGQKLNGVPTAKGLYIVNGRKVLVK